MRMMMVFIISGIITCPLMWEDWFSWRMWLVACLLLTLKYYLYYIGQENNMTLTKTILMRIDKLIGKNNRDISDR